MDDYTTMALIKQRHAELIEDARQYALRTHARPHPGRLRLAVGTVLIRIGAWLLRRAYAPV